MWRLRLLALPFMAIVELSVLAACWALAYVRPQAARRLMSWATRTLPELRWYIGEDV